jgi:acetylornithine/N-succinyldiaminopimelate aminotransferase
MTAAKALGGGLPVGAVVTNPDLGDVFEPGDHGSTFAGGPVGAVAALAALEILGGADLLAGVRASGERLRHGLQALDGVSDVRGRGLMAGVSLDEGVDAAGVRDRCLDAGLVVNSPGAAMLRFLPPLVIQEAEVDKALSVLGEALAG